MTNPYAPPEASGEPRPSGGGSSLLKQFLWLVVVGIACGVVMAFLSLTFRLWHPIAKHVAAWAPLWMAMGWRAWFCCDLRELLTAGLALSWGCLWTLMYIALLLPIPFQTAGAIEALVILPPTLALAGWPLMVLGTKTR